MGQPVKLSDSLVLDARIAGEESERSLAGQIEFWARLGCAIEHTLRFDALMQLKRLGASKPLSDCLREVTEPEGREHLNKVLNQRPFPHFEPSDRPGVLVKIDENGARTEGRFVNRKFVPAQ